MSEKKLKLEVGQTILLVKDHKNKREVLSEWDVIKVNKKSIVLQQYPTYELRILKR